MLEDIDRIEVVSGPGATLWGANAVNGVINVITRTAQDTQGALVAGGGGNRETGGSARYGGRLPGDGHYRVYGKSFHRDNSQLTNGTPIRDSSTRSQAGFRADWVDAGANRSRCRATRTPATSTRRRRRGRSGAATCSRAGRGALTTARGPACRRTPTSRIASTPTRSRRTWARSTSRPSTRCGWRRSTRSSWAAATGMRATRWATARGRRSCRPTATCSGRMRSCRTRSPCTRTSTSLSAPKSRPTSIPMPSSCPTCVSPGGRRPTRWCGRRHRAPSARRRASTAISTRPASRRTSSRATRPSCPRWPMSTRSGIGRNSRWPPR